MLKKVIHIRQLTIYIHTHKKYNAHVLCEKEGYIYIYKKENNLIILLLPSHNLGLTSVKEQTNETQGIICVGIVSCLFFQGGLRREKTVISTDVSEDEKKAIYSRLVQQQLNKESLVSAQRRRQEEEVSCAPTPTPNLNPNPTSPQYW